MRALKWFMFGLLMYGLGYSIFWFYVETMATRTNLLNDKIEDCKLCKVGYCDSPTAERSTSTKYGTLCSDACFGCISNITWTLVLRKVLNSTSLCGPVSCRRQLYNFTHDPVGAFTVLATFMGIQGIVGTLGLLVKNFGSEWMRARQLKKMRREAEKEAKINPALSQLGFSVAVQ